VKEARALIGALMLMASPPAFALKVQEAWELVAMADAGNRTAIESLLRNYQAQDPEAVTAIGVLYLNGVVYPRDLTKAREYFEWASSLNGGSAWAKYWLAVIYANGLGVPADTERALYYAEESSKGGYVGGGLIKAQILYAVKRQLSWEEFAKAVQKAFTQEPDDPVVQGYRGRLVYAQAFSADDPLKAGNLLMEAREAFAKAARAHFLYRDFYAYMLYFGLGGEPNQKRALELAQPLLGFTSNATGLLPWDLYFGNVQGQDHAQACALARKYFDRSNLRGNILRAVYGLCLMDEGKRVEGYAHLLKASATDFLTARALAKEREKELSKEELERAKALLKDLP
jgi:TPR repeat protein